MSKRMQCSIFAVTAAVLVSASTAFGAANHAAVPESAASIAPPAPAARASSQRLSPKDKLALDRSGKHRVGKASFYAHMFSGRKMANGKLMDPKHNNAASLTLPLGTTAKVTNLATGKSAVVTIQDRGPYVSGRIVDLSPATAAAIGITPRQGVAKVQVSPITIPQPNGETIYGAAIQDARLASNDQAHRQFPPVGW
jgi:rare lipoprotein A